ncbi:MAG: hypothetical protein AAFY20_27170 [Cyanobacteria bacterium J06639_14]
MLYPYIYLKAALPAPPSSALNCRDRPLSSRLHIQPCRIAIAPVGYRLPSVG